MNNAQQELDDEILSACHDGELPPSEVEAVRRRLAREPELAARLHAIQHVDAAATGALRAQDGLPLPERVLKLLEAAEREDARRRATSNVVFLGEAVTRRRRWSAVPKRITSALRRLRVRFAAKKR